MRRDSVAGTNPAIQPNVLSDELLPAVALLRGAPSTAGLGALERTSAVIAAVVARGHRNMDAHAAGAERQAGHFFFWPGSGCGALSTLAGQTLTVTGSFLLGIFLHLLKAIGKPLDNVRGD